MTEAVVFRPTPDQMDLLRLLAQGYTIGLYVPAAGYMVAARAGGGGKTGRLLDAIDLGAYNLLLEPPHPPGYWKKEEQT